VINDSLTGLSGSSSSSGGSSASTDNAATVVPQLQDLKLSHCQLTLELASQLLRSTSLTKLQWEGVQLYTDDWTRQLQLCQTVSVLLEKLTLLPELSSLKLGFTHVEEEHWTTAHADLAHFSKLQSLQDLSVVVESHSTAVAVAAAVPAGLTALALDASAINIGPGHNAPELCLTRLANLLRFSGQGVCMQPSSLGSMTWLRELDIEGPRYANGDRWAPGELLTALQHLTQLQHLGLRNCKLYQDAPWQRQEANCRCFAALTASTQLTSLVLTQLCFMPIPQVAFEHMFPAGHVLPHLKDVLIRTDHTSPEQYCVEAAEVAKLTASCPALQVLGLVDVTPLSFGTHECLLQLLPDVIVRGRHGLIVPC
jgi:hypothetical protein